MKAPAHPGRPRGGFTLLETMVALIILGLVVAASLQLYGSALRSAYRASAWATATAYAEEGMELAKLDLAGMEARGLEILPEGFERRVRVRPVGGALSQVTVSVVFPGGGAYEVHRLVEVP